MINNVNKIHLYKVFIKRSFKNYLSRLTLKNQYNQIFLFIKKLESVYSLQHL